MPYRSVNGRNQAPISIMLPPKSAPVGNSPADRVLLQYVIENELMAGAGQTDASTRPTPFRVG
jgi:hypothetical protein